MSRFAVLFAMIASAAVAANGAAQDANHASTAPQQEPRRGPTNEVREFRGGVAGTITAISPDTLTVKQATNGDTVTVKLNDKTEYRKDREPAKLSDFKVGDFVLVRGEHTSETEVAAQAVMSGPGGERRFVMRGPGGDFNGSMADLGKTFVIGEVKSINAPAITVHRPDGQDQTIQADENTSFRKAGESITLPDIKVGDTVMARGELKDGMFVPTQLNVLDRSQMQVIRHRPTDEQKPQQTPPQQEMK
jgi:hypothetical protein